MKYYTVTFFGGTGARLARTGDARTGQMAEFDAACDLTQPVPPHERWSRAQPRCSCLRDNSKTKQEKQAVYGMGTVGGLISAIGSGGVGEGDVEWYCQVNVFAWCTSRDARAHGPLSADKECR